MSSESAQGEARTDAVAVRRERLRFTGFSLVRSPSGRVTCEVTLEWAPGEAILGRAEGQASPAGDARLGQVDLLPLVLGQLVDRVPIGGAVEEHHHDADLQIGGDNSAAPAHGH